MGEVACWALVLEDDRAIAMLLKTVLRREGLRAEHVSKGRDAIDCLSSNRYHLVVIDLMVPDRGELVIEYIKHHQLDVLRSIIVVTAAPNAIRNALRGEYPEPICKFVAKPFDMHEFVQLVHACKETCDGDHAPSD